jgi:hypothetical protein
MNERRKAHAHLVRAFSPFVRACGFFAARILRQRKGFSPMPRSKRHAVVVVPRPQGWEPKKATDLPTPLVHTDHVALGQAAEVARRFNESELTTPTGRWAIAAKSLVPARPAKGGAA